RRADRRGVRARRRRAGRGARRRRPEHDRHSRARAGGLRGCSMTTFTNARVVTAFEVFRGSVFVGEDGVISAVERAGANRPGALDLEGDFLLPGIVELHTDMLERHAIPRPGVEWPPVAAVVGFDCQLIGAGITTVLDSLAFGYLYDAGQRPKNPRALIEAIHEARAAGLLRADHYPHLRCEASTEAVVDDCAPLASDPPVRLQRLVFSPPG